MNDISVTGFQIVPGFARGLVRDLRVRWALREAGIDYNVEQIAFDQRQSPAYLRRNPFGQVPTMRMGVFDMFESGAIVYAIGLKSPALLPEDEAGRLEVLSWMFAALNTLEPAMQTLLFLDRAYEGDQGGVRDFLVGSIETRLAQLGQVLQGKDYLAGRFTIADIMMTTTLRFIRHTDLVAAHASVAAYLERCTARPQFQAALSEQDSEYSENDRAAA